MHISDRCPGDYVGVLLATKDRHLIVQRRDDKDWIVWPDSLGVWGGNVEGTETLGEAAKRELKEELGLDIDPTVVSPFRTYHQTMETHGQTVTCHIFLLSDIEPESLIVSEGQGYKILTPEDDITSIKASPVMKEIFVDYFNSI